MATVARSPFFSIIAIALVVFTIVGFSRTYYFRFLSDLPPLSLLVHIHSLVFTAWAALFVVQVRLIARQRVDLHMKWGMAGIVIAVLILITGFFTVAARAAVPRIHPSGLLPPQFTVVGISSLLLFAAFLGLGLLNRKRPEYHKRYMVLAMIAVITPPSSRILTMLGLREYFSLLVPVMPTAFIVWCLARDWMRQRLVHPVFAVGGLVLVVAWPLRLAIGFSDWYRPIGEWILSVGENMGTVPVS